MYFYALECSGFQIPRSGLENDQFSVSLRNDGDDLWTGARFEVRIGNETNEEDDAVIVCTGNGEDDVIRVDAKSVAFLNCQFFESNEEKGVPTIFCLSNETVSRARIPRSIA